MNNITETAGDPPGKERARLLQRAAPENQTCKDELLARNGDAVKQNRIQEVANYFIEVEAMVNSGKNPVQNPEQADTAHCYIGETVFLALAVGWYLTEVKAGLERGDFGNWLDLNIKNFGLRTAQRYMKLWRNRHKLTQFGYWQTDLCQAYLQTGVVVSPSKSREVRDNECRFAPDEDTKPVESEPVIDAEFEELEEEAEPELEGEQLFHKQNKPIEQKRQEREDRRREREEIDDGRGDLASDSQLRAEISVGCEMLFPRGIECILKERARVDQRGTARRMIIDWLCEKYDLERRTA